ncbi:MAG: oxidoreductase [Lachnospiraceae bacterium]|nr:oxidoreductase [Lachnospiraceae bacterium]
MTVNCSNNISPDGITGMIFGLEGIRRTVVLLNGPMGCRFYHSTTSQFLTIRPLLCMPSDTGDKVPVDYNYLNNWFFRQQRVPCTWLDGHDYVYGTEEKVREGILHMKEHIAFDLLAVVNSPGASLIGDRLLEIVHELLPDKDCVLMESPGFSVEYDYGYEQACLQLLSQNRLLDVKTEGRRQEGKLRVNVIGLSIFDRYFEGDREEIGRILALCGLEAGCFLMADCSMEEIRNLPDADLNLVINPQRGKRIAEALEKHYGTPFYVCDGLPVGFAAVEKMCRDLASLLGTDSSAVLEESRRARAYAWYKINGIYESSGLPQGALFAVSGSFAQVYAYTAFLTGYLGMLPDALELETEPQPSERKMLTRLLAEYHSENALRKPLEETAAEIVLGNANVIASLTARKGEDLSAGQSADGGGRLSAPPFSGIEISLPGMGYTDLVKKTHLGISGALFLTEQILNGLMTRL